MFEIEDGRVIVNRRLRLSCVHRSLVRIQFAEDGDFETRQSVRAVGSNNNAGFDSIEEKDGLLLLASGDFLIKCDPDKEPLGAGSLAAYCGERLVWQPDLCDEANLGGVHLGMDCVQRGVIPKGVHKAGADYHKNDTSCHLWNYVFADKDTQPDAHYYGGLVTIEQLLAKDGKEKLVPSVRRLIEEREKYPPSFLSKSGFFLYNDSDTAVYDRDMWPCQRKAGEDWYLFLYGDDYRLAYEQYLCLFGRPEFMPRYVLGLWFSRYPTYEKEKILELYERFAERGVPLDVFVFDLEWHKRGWYGFDWDEDRYPDYGAMLADLKHRGIRLAVNIHPDGLRSDDSCFEDFVRHAGLEQSWRQKIKDNVFKPVDLSDKAVADAFFSVFHRPLIDCGIDIMWIDGHAHSSIAGLDKQLWTNELYQRFLRSHRDKERPVILSRTEGLGSHRYPVHFTGDAYSQFEVLASQVEYTLRAGHMAQAVVSHDIGGHMWRFKHLNPELLCRWYQFGAMSPVFRLHSSGGSERVPWEYDEIVEKSFYQALRWRYSLLPYFYTLMRENYDTGLPLCRSFALAYPHWEEGSRIWDEYMLGDRILCTPFVSEGGYRSVILPEGRWFYPVSGESYEGDGSSSFVLLGEADFTPPHFVRAGSLLIKQSAPLSAAILPDELVIELYPDKAIDDSISIYEDDGISTGFAEGDFCYTDFCAKGDRDKVEFSVKFRGDSRLIPAKRSYILRVYDSRSFTLETKEGSFKADKRTDKSLYPAQSFFEVRIPAGVGDFCISFD